MPRTIPPGTPYSGRALGRVPKNMTLDAYAVELLHELVPARKTLGDFVSALIIAEAARRDERRRMRQVLDAALVPAES